MQESRMNPTSTAGLHYTRDFSIKLDASKNKVLSSEIQKLRKLDSGQIMACTNKCGNSVNTSRPNSAASLVSHSAHDNQINNSDIYLTSRSMSRPNSAASFAAVNSTHDHNRITNNCSNIYLLASPQSTQSMSYPCSEEPQNNKYSREIFIEKNLKHISGSPLIVQPSYNHKIRNRNVRNVYSATRETHTRTNSHGSGYDSDVSEDTPLGQASYKPSSYIRSVPHSPTVVPKTMQKPSVQMFPVHPSTFKEQSCLGYNNVYSRAKESVYPHFPSSLEMSLRQSPAPPSDSLTVKQRQLDETTEQLRMAKEMVKQLEEEAQVKTWQALKEQEAILKQKEEALRYREVMAQKKYEEAERLLEEFRKLSSGCERVKDKQSMGGMLNPSLHDDSLTMNSLSDKDIQYFNNAHDLNKKLPIPPNSFNQSDFRSFSSENHYLSDSSAGLEPGSNSFPNRNHSKSSSKLGGRKSKKNYFALNMCEVKPSIEPGKILRTYSRKNIRKECIQPKIELQSSPSYDHSQNRPLPAESVAIDIPASAMVLKEQVLVNESGTITITQLPKVSQPIRPCSKRKSDRYNPMTTVSHQLKKCPSRIDTDTSPYSSSSDISGYFTEKVEKLTSSTSMQTQRQTSRVNKPAVTTSLSGTPPAEGTRKSPSPVDETTNNISNQKRKETTDDEDEQLCVVKTEGSSSKKINSKGTLSIVNLQGVSLPSHSDATVLSSYQNFTKAKGCDPLSSENNEHSNDMKSFSNNSATLILPQYKTEDCKIEPVSYSQKELIEETSSDNHSLLRRDIKLDQTNSSKDFSLASSYTTSYEENTTKRSGSEIPSELDAPVVPTESGSQISSPFISLSSLNSEANMNNALNFTDTEDNSQSKVREMASQQMIQNASQPETLDEDPIADKPSSNNVEPVYILSTRSDSIKDLPKENSTRIVHNYATQTLQNCNFNANTRTLFMDESSSNIYEKVNCKNNTVFLPSPSKNMARDISIVQSLTSPLNPEISPHLPKLNIEHLQPSNKVLKVQKVEEALQPVPDKPYQYNEGLQINNIQNIVFDVKNINQTSFSFTSDKRTSSIDLQPDGGNIPSDIQTICSISPFIHCDQRLMQCIINNSDQAVYYTPTVVYTSPPQNMLNSYATNTISSCISSPMILDEPQTKSFPENTSNLEFKSDQSNVFNVDEEDKSTSPLVTHIESSEALMDVDNGEDSVMEEVMEEDSHDPLNEVVMEDSHDPLNEISEQEEVQILHNESDHNFTLSPSKEVDFLEKNLPVDIDENSTEQVSLLDESIQSQDTPSPSLSQLDNKDAWLDKSKDCRTDFDDNAELNVFESLSEKERPASCDNSLITSSDALEENTDNEWVKESKDPLKNVCLSSKGGRVLKLKEWWSDIITESSSKKSTKPMTENHDNQKTAENEEELDNDNAEVSPPKKKRGRPKLNKSKNSPKGRGKGENSDENFPCFWDTYILPPSHENYTNFECGKCSVVANSAEEFKNHVFKVHSGLARLKGESQEFELKQENKILKIVFAKQNILHCDACEKVYKSILGFQYHRKTCKILDQNLHLFCKFCKKLFSKSSAHSCRAGRERENEEELKKNSEDFQTGRRKRKAAKSCHDQMRLLYSNIGLENDSNDKDFEEEEDKFKRHFTRKPYLPKTLDLDEFMKNIRESGESSCIHDGCESTFSCVKKLKMHLKSSCPKSEKIFECKNCDSILKENELMEHLQKEHSDCLSDSASDMESDTENINLPSERKSSTNLLYTRPCVPAKKMTLEFRSANYSQELYPELTCHSSKWAEVEDFSSYLHNSRLQFSPLFKIENFKTKKTPRNLWERLDTFSGKKIGLGEILYAGGPIRSSAWCPTPNTPHTQKRTPQYIALATISNPNEVFPINKSSRHKGMIQIWECGNLVEAEEPGLALCIVHEYGVAWSLDWCPSGIYENPNDEIAEKNSTLNRLGFLAAAFSDGSVRLYLVPHPHQILSKSKFFKKVPEFSLLPYNHEAMEVQCVKVSWCASKGHSLIAGSFTNGMVCIWDLTNASPLLNVKDENGGNIVYPINSIPAHNGVCSTVSFCPRTDGQHIVTGGNDRTIKFWDLAQPEQPLTMIKKGIVTDSVWLPHWAGSFICFDDAFSIGKTATTFRENGFHGATYRPILGTNATAWSLSGSDWLNALAQVDEAGEVMVAKLTRLTCEISSEKYLSKKRYPIFSVRLENLKDHNVLSLKKDYKLRGTVPFQQFHKNKGNMEDNSNSKNGKVNPQEFKEQPLTLSEAAEIYGLNICDNEYTNFRKIHGAAIRTKQFSEYMEPGPLTVYPLMGASSIAWNNNWGTHSWIFVGLNSGLGRIIRLSFLETIET